MNEYLVSQLKKGRLDKGLKQSDVAQKTGIKNTTLSNYENGVTEPDMDTFLTLCELYELDFVSLIEEAYGINVPGKNFHIKPSEIELLKKYNALNSDSQKYVTEVIDREYRRDSRLVEGQISLIPENGYVQIYKNGKWQDYMKTDDFFALPNAAHHIANSSSDDQKHDDDLMNNEQF